MHTHSDATALYDGDLLASRFEKMSPRSHRPMPVGSAAARIRGATRSAGRRPRRNRPATGGVHRRYIKKVDGYRHATLSFS